VHTWQKIFIPTFISLLIGGIYLFSVYEHRKNPGVIGQSPANQPIKPDDLAVVREKFQQHYEDVLELVGTSVWMKNGYTMPYYPYRGSIVFKRAGVIPSDQRLDIKKIVKATPPAHEDDSISHGSRQVFAVFTMPGSPELYASPVGVIDGSDESYFCDLLFYYDDPHTIYDNWPKDVWAAIDAHQVKPGMSELQVRTAIGQKVLNTDGGEQGNRRVTYDVNGKHWTVTFAHDRATAVKGE
jgi:hypothetical protein